MKDKQDRKLPRQRPRPSALAQLIPMVGLFQSGLADWRSASAIPEEEQSAVDEEEKGGK